VILPKGETVMDEDLVKNSVEEDCETLVRVGWRVGGR
jgi:phosphatidylserine decarboxylase